MRISKKILACVLATLMVIAMMPITAFADYTIDGPTLEYSEITVAAYSEDDENFDQFSGDYCYEWLVDENQFNHVCWKLTEDIVTTGPIVIPAGADMQIDLNGHTLSGYVADEDGKKLIQAYGKVEFVGDNGGCIYNTNTAGQGHAACQALTGGTVIVSAPITFGDSDEIRNNTNTTNRGCGIQNNGGTLIINNGYYTAIDANYSTGAWAYAILNCAGDTVVNNATVYGNGLHGALGCESGTLTVNDGTFAVNGANNYYSLYADDGGEIIVNGGTFTDNSKYGVNYVGTGSKTTISGGTFTYASTTPFVQSSSKANPVVSGGTFSGDVSAYLADGCSQTNGTVALAGVAKINSTYYETLEAAVSAAKSGDTITLVSDVDLTNYPAKGQHRINIDGKTIDLNTHKITASGRWGIIFEGNNATIKNGTMEAIDNSDAAGYQYGVYVWGGDGSNNMPDPEQKASVTLEDLTINYGVHTYNADVTIKNCDVTGSSAYYAVWCDIEGNAVIESGNFTTGGAAVVGTAQYQNSYFGQIRVDGGNFTVPAGKKLVQTGSSCVPANTKFYGGTVKNADGSVFTVADNNLGFKCTQNMTTGEVSPSNEEVNDGTNITVADEISQNFYLDDDFYGNDAYVAVTYNTNTNVDESATIGTEIKAMSSLPVLDSSDKYDGNRIVSITQAPAQVTEDVVINVYASQADAQAGTNAVKTLTYSTYDYCTNLIENYTGAKETEVKNLAKATLDYAAAAQTYFNYNTENMATAEASGDFYNDVANVNLSSVTGITSRPAEIKNVTVVVKSDLEINLLSKTPVAVNSFSWDATSGGSRFDVSALDEPNGSWYVINIKGIEPANMDSTITINTNGVPIELSANSIMKIMANSSNANMATLAKAMYLYGQAANAYFD